MNAVIIEIKPIRGNTKLLTAPMSTPVLTITIENSPLGAASVKADRSDFLLFCLKMKFPSKFPPNFIKVATKIRTRAKIM